MNELDPRLALEVARRVANEAAAEHGLKHVAQRDSKNFLSDGYLEAEGCWYFFPADSVEVPEKYWHLQKFAVAVSKFGRVSIVYDFRENDQKMQEYLEVVSLHSLGRFEQARAAMAAFQKKYPEP